MLKKFFQKKNFLGTFNFQFSANFPLEGPQAKSAWNRRAFSQGPSRARANF